MGTRICQADADANADTNGFRTETNMSPGDIKIIICTMDDVLKDVLRVQHGTPEAAVKSI